MELTLNVRPASHMVRKFQTNSPYPYSLALVSNSTAALWLVAGALGLATDLKRREADLRFDWVIQTNDAFADLSKWFPLEVQRKTMA